jgi:tetratricopeptide (TPR) repeat protein
MLKNTLENLKHNIIEKPNDKQAVDKLANAYAQLKDWHKACVCYAEYLQKVPDDAEGYFNYAYNLRFAGKYEQAIVEYRKALALNISQPEEIHVNIAVILADYLRREECAIEELECALKINNNYVPALYNLANLYEDSGNKQKAEHLFLTIITIDPQYYDALARLAQITSFSIIDDSLIHKLIVADNNKNIDISTKINVNFALGKAFDECGDYDRAFSYFETANQLTQATMPAYKPEINEQFIDKIKDVFNNIKVNKLKCVSDAEPIFICGMFRSGSTLVEQILAAHPKLTAGGEREYFIRLVESSLAPFPTSLLNTALEKFEVIAQEYLVDLIKAFPDAERVIDKRPENFLFVGLIKILFPKARIVYTQRNILDNCLSVYFLRLGVRMNYSLTLSSTFHYYKMHAHLMDFWKSQYNDSIHTISYDKLVKQPEEEIKHLLTFLGLDWDANCLNFHQIKNKVKTASVWQVRKPLYSTSSGRWKNYEKHLSDLIHST